MRDAALQVLRLVPSPVPEQGPESGEFEVALPCSAPLFQTLGRQTFSPASPPLRQGAAAGTGHRVHTASPVWHRNTSDTWNT